MRLVLPAAVIRSAPEDGVLLDDEVGLRSELSVVDTLGFGIVLYKTRKQMSWNGMIGAKACEKKNQHQHGTHTAAWLFAAWVLAAEDVVEDWVIANWPD